MHAPHSQPTVRTDAEALEVLFHAMQQPAEAETLAFLLDEHWQGGVILAVSDTHRLDAVLDVVDIMARASEAVPRAAYMVVGSVRPTSGFHYGDVHRWVEASDIARHSGLELVEWYVIGSGGVELPRLRYGDPSRWATYR